MLDKFVQIYTESEYLIKPVLFIALATSIFLDVSRIKVDPWKWILHKIARVFNSDIIKAFTDIENSVDVLSEKIEDLENEVQSILDFANNNDAYKSYLYKNDKLRYQKIYT